MYEIMYSVQIFQEELCCNHHLAASAPCRTSSAWSVNSMAVFAYKSTLCETPESVVSGGFIWFHQTSPSEFDIQIVSKPLKEEDTLFASHGT